MNVDFSLLNEEEKTLMGNSDSSSPFDDAAQNAHDSALARTGSGEKAAEAATVVYAKKAMYDSAMEGPIPDSSIGGALFDLGSAIVDATKSPPSSKQNKPTK